MNNWWINPTETTVGSFERERGKNPMEIHSSRVLTVGREQIHLSFVTDVINVISALGLKITCRIRLLHPPSRFVFLSTFACFSLVCFFIFLFSPLGRSVLSLLNKKYI